MLLYDLNKYMFIYVYIHIYIYALCMYTYTYMLAESTLRTKDPARVLALIQPRVALRYIDLSIYIYIYMYTYTYVHIDDCIDV